MSKDEQGRPLTYWGGPVGNKQETLEEAKLRQLFKNRSNCYADSEDVVQAMDEDCFIETINEWQQEQDKNKYSEEDLILFYDFIENHQLRKYGDIWKRITNDPNDRPLGFESVDDKYVIEWFEQFKKEIVKSYIRSLKQAQNDATSVGNHKQNNASN